MSNDAEKGREPEQGYISPFIVLPHTLTREESKNLRETVYKYFEGQQRDTEWRRKRFKTEFVDEELDSMVFDEEEE